LMGYSCGRDGTWRQKLLGQKGLAKKFTEGGHKRIRTVNFGFQIVGKLSIIRQKNITGICKL
jgi:hypothetical protein